VWVRADGTVHDVPLSRPNGDPLPQVYAPELSVDVDADGQLLTLDGADLRDQATRQGWELLDGYSGQYGYGGPIMHPSEYVGGDLERDILAEPGVYVVTTVACLGPDESDDQDGPDIAGWVVARRMHADYPHFPGRLYDCAACELGPCEYDPTTDAPCVSIDCKTGGE
jgi:hypothetical protein